MLVGVAKWAGWVTSRKGFVQVFFLDYYKLFVLDIIGKIISFSKFYALKNTLVDF